MKLHEIKEGIFVKVDDEDLDLVKKYTWSLFTGGHVSARIPELGATVAMHRLLYKGIVLPHQEIHHKNNNPLDNQKRNLVALDKAAHRHMDGVRKDTPSKYKGVLLDRRPSRTPKNWYAVVRKNGEIFFLGYFLTPEDAAHAYDAKAQELFGPNCYLNFPNQQTSNEKRPNTQTANNGDP